MLLLFINKNLKATEILTDDENHYYQYSKNTALYNFLWF